MGSGACAHLDDAERLELSRQWVGVYHSHAALSSDLDVRERGHADLLLLLAAQLLVGEPVGEWLSPGASYGRRPVRLLLRAALLLQMGLNKAPHNFQLSLALVQCMLCLGSPREACAAYARCDIKQIQHESLAHTHLPALEQLGCTTLLKTHLLPVQKFQHGGLKEMADCIGVAFQSGEAAPTLPDPHLHTRPRPPPPARPPSLPPPFPAASLP